MQYPENNNILYDHDLQHGFRCGRSCESQLLSLVHELMHNHDSNIQSEIILMDFAKTFDKVLHKRLLHKLQRYRIKGNIYHWIKSFLSDRLQKTIIDGTSFSLVPVTSGVPQGTVLGPFLFLIYINDQPDYIQYSTLRLFADDCILHICIDQYNLKPTLFSFKKTLIHFQKDIDSLFAWTIIIMAKEAQY